MLILTIAMGVGGIKFGTVGDGVPGADLKDYPLPTKGSVAFNFADQFFKNLI